jgi:hypothetical protein
LASDRDGSGHERLTGELRRSLDRQANLRNASSILVSNAAGEILSTFAVGLAALSLGPTGFGTLAEAQAFMDPFETLAGFGLIQVSITLAAARGGCDATLRTTVMVLRLGFAAVAIAVAFGVAMVTDRGALAPLLLLLAINSLVSPLTQASTLPFQCEQSMHRLMTVPFLSSIVRVGTSYVAFWLLCTPFGFQVSATVAAVVTALLTYLFARRYYGVGFSFRSSVRSSPHHRGVAGEGDARGHRHGLLPCVVFSLARRRRGRAGRVCGGGPIGETDFGARIRRGGELIADHCRDGGAEGVWRAHRRVQTIGGTHRRDADADCHRSVPADAVLATPVCADLRRRLELLPHLDGRRHVHVLESAVVGVHRFARKIPTDHDHRFREPRSSTSRSRFP